MATVCQSACGVSAVLCCACVRKCVCVCVCPMRCTVPCCAVVRVCRCCPTHRVVERIARDLIKDRRGLHVVPRHMPRHLRDGVVPRVPRRPGDHPVHSNAAQPQERQAKQDAVQDDAIRRAQAQLLQHREVRQARKPPQSAAAPKQASKPASQPAVHAHAARCLRAYAQRSARRPYDVADVYLDGAVLAAVLAAVLHGGSEFHSTDVFGIVEISVGIFEEIPQLRGGSTA